MSEKCPSCGSCGMPMQSVDDLGSKNPESRYCTHCTDADGNLTATYETVVSYYADDYKKRRGIDDAQAKKLAEAFVSQLPAWQVQKAT